MAVGMRTQVYRDTVDLSLQVRSVVELEAAQIVLVGFASPTVLTDDEARNIFENFAGPQQRSRRDLLLADGAGRCRERLANKVRLPPDSHAADLLESLRARGR